ncbi:MAG: hypothetical protein HC896_18925 [Bacteroidales bacterium]|nr:hypothetical protein [Bacteroidales bacterium]
MAKTKKDISAFQKAMLSNTKIITGQQAPNQETGKPLDPALVNAIEKLAAKHGRKTEDLVNLGIKTVIELETFFFKT